MNVTVSVDTIYDLRLAQPNKKKGKNEAREARRFLRLYEVVGVVNVSVRARFSVTPIAKAG